MLANNKCSSWYDRVGDLSLSVRNRRKRNDVWQWLVCEVGQTNPNPEWEANGTECLVVLLCVSDLLICTVNVLTLGV